MRTKGIRQAEGESPYTVKTSGATWLKEGGSAPLTLHLSSWDVCNESQLAYMQTLFFCAVADSSSD